MQFGKVDAVFARVLCRLPHIHTTRYQCSSRSAAARDHRPTWPTHPAAGVVEVPTARPARRRNPHRFPARSTRPNPPDKFSAWSLAIRHTTPPRRRAARCRRGSPPPRHHRHRRRRDRRLRPRLRPRPLRSTPASADIIMKFSAFFAVLATLFVSSQALVARPSTGLRVARALPVSRAVPAIKEVRWDFRPHCSGAAAAHPPPTTARHAKP